MSRLPNFNFANLYGISNITNLYIAHEASVKYTNNEHKKEVEIKKENVVNDVINNVVKDVIVNNVVNYEIINEDVVNEDVVNEVKEEETIERVNVTKKTKNSKK